VARVPDPVSASPESERAAAGKGHGPIDLPRLGPLLCWAIVYADIGTSVYYVPGILYGDVGKAAPSFVLATGLVFVLLAEKYAEISGRYPNGGGVVSAAGEAFGARVGAVGGMLLLVDYFNTAAISAASGFAYLGSLFPGIQPIEGALAVVGLVLLGLLNWIGIRESATASAIFGGAALATLLALLAMTTLQADAQQWHTVRASLAAASEVPLGEAVVGFAAAWLAFSGLESIAQISPAMREPRRRTARIAMIFVVIALLATSPLLTAFGTNVIDASKADPDALQSELAFSVGGPWLRAFVVISASGLLLFAANTAIVGTYHVFCALADGGFLPGPLLRRSARFGTPTVAITTAVVVPVAVLVATRGNIEALGHLYAFGLLGAFSLSSLALDRVRIAEGRTDLTFALGLIATVLVLVAWLTSLVTRPTATMFGASAVGTMVVLSLAYRRGLPGRAATAPSVSAEEAEKIAAERPSAERILTIAEAMELEAAFSPKTIVCVRGPNERLLEEVAAHLAGKKEWSVALLYVDEVPGLFVPRDTEPTPEARRVLEEATRWFDARGMTALPIWRLSADAGEAIARVAERLDVEAVFVGTSQRGRLWHMLRGNVIARLIARSPARTRIVIVG
jgi:amino acid transporter/nucleotide-binding universal stress UspA family protein